MHYEWDAKRGFVRSTYVPKKKYAMIMFSDGTVNMFIIYFALWILQK